MYSNPTGTGALGLGTLPDLPLRTSLSSCSPVSFNELVSESVPLSSVRHSVN